MDTKQISAGSGAIPKSVSAFFEVSRKAEAAAKALADTGFTPEEVLQTEQNGGILVTVKNNSRVSEAAAILEQHDGSLSGDYSEFAEAIREEASVEPTDVDPDDGSARSRPMDSGLTEVKTDRPAGGGTYSSGSSAGGSGSGTASGGGLFGSSR